jgi:hypothetical protein
MKKALIIGILITVKFNSISQQNFWNTGVLNDGSIGNLFGTQNNQPIAIYTNSIQRAFFTSGNFLTTPYDLIAPNSGSGDGLMIRAQGTSQSNLEMFTALQGTTHIKWGVSGAISGQNGRFEQFANGSGFYFNAREAGGRFKFARGTVITGMIGTNNFWRIGEQADGANLNGARRLEVVDNTWQFRITRSPNGAFTDFETRTNGNFTILPTGGNVGINMGTNPTSTLDVNGNARIRDVQVGVPNSILIGVNAGGSADVNVRRLDFSGNSQQVLLGNGTWGTLPPTSPINGASNAAWISPSGNVEWGTTILEHNTEIPMGIYKVLYRTGVNSNNTVTIGGAVYQPSSRLYVDNDNLANGAVIRSYSWNGVSVASRTGIGSYAYDADFLYGTYTLGFRGSRVHGLFAYGRDGSVYTTGVRGLAVTSNPNSVVYGGDYLVGGTTYYENVGVRGDANGCLKQNIGGMFRAGNTGTLAIGVYGESPDQATYSGSSYAGYFVGNTVITGASLWVSDSTLKENISPISDALDSLLLSLQPMSYTFKQDGDAQRLNLKEGTQFGVLAQQVEPLFPTLVHTVTHPAQYDTLGIEISPSFTYKAVDVSQLVPIMLSDLQRKTAIINNQTNELNILNSTVDSLIFTITNLNERLTLLENCLSNLLPALCQANQMAIQQTPQETQEYLEKTINITLSNRNNIILNQNVPNPFAESTVISYSIPSTVQKAQIHFYDGQGKLINTLEINERGNGQLNVFANDLSTGVYTYSLVADGQIVATKRMMKN